MISTLSGRQFTRLVARRYNAIASVPLRGKATAGIRPKLVGRREREEESAGEKARERKCGAGDEADDG